jgi:hypothetical protein
MLALLSFREFHALMSPAWCSPVLLSLCLLLCQPIVDEVIDIASHLHILVHLLHQFGELHQFPTSYPEEIGRCLYVGLGRRSWDRMLRSLMFLQFLLEFRHDLHLDFLHFQVQLLS